MVFNLDVFGGVFEFLIDQEQGIEVGEVGNCAEVIGVFSVAQRLVQLEGYRVLQFLNEGVLRLFVALGLSAVIAEIRCQGRLLGDLRFDFVPSGPQKLRVKLHLLVWDRSRLHRLWHDP